MSWKSISIAKIEMTNFKRFYGTHTVDLPRPNHKRPIVLIGGENMRGKTSIHEAINYALYVDDDLPGINTWPSYVRAISDRLNLRALREGRRDYGVAIELRASDNGIERLIRIERQWDVNIAQRMIEKTSLRIFDNGRPASYIEDDPVAYQDFLRNLLPPKIAPFFFFDGERIQQFAEDNGRESKMVEAIEDILHINTYRLLRSDLKTHVVDYLERTEVSKSADDNLYLLMAAQEEVKGSLDKSKNRVEEIDREVEELSIQRKKLETEIRRTGSPHSQNREELIAERARLNAELEAAKYELQRAFESLPLLLSGKLLGSLRQTLLNEQGIMASPEGVERLETQLAEIKKRLFSDISPEPPPKIALSSNQLAFYENRFDEVCRDVFRLSKKNTKRIIHDIGNAEKNKILERISEVEKKGMRLRYALDTREKVTNELREVDNKLQASSDDPYVDTLLENYKQANVRIGELGDEKQRLEAEIQRFSADLAAKNRQIEEVQQRRDAKTKAEQTIQLAQNIRRTLDEFIKRLAPEKLALLRQYMEEMYWRLRKPEDPVCSIEVDPETWEIILRGDDGYPLEKRVFSAGMKEIYALSLLWALSKASCRELPIVIDTPVGRLDSTNRRALYEKYLPHAGHQVIFLSTDTEMTIDWAERLKPYIACEYRLDYDATLDSTVIHPGYFVRS